MTSLGRRTAALALLGAAALGAGGAVAVAPRALGAQEPVRPAPAAAAGIEFDFQDTELRVVLAALAEAAGVNVLLSEIPSRAVSLRTSRPIPRAEARAYLESFVRSQGLTMADEGGLVRIFGAPAGAPAAATTAAAAAAAAQRRPPEPVRLFVYRLNHGDAEAMAATIGTLFGIGNGGGGAAGGGRFGAGSLSDQLAAQRLGPNILPGDPPPPAPAPALPVAADTLGAAPGTGLTAPVQLVPDPRTNSLLIRATTADYATIRGAIEQLDVRPVQVLIEVLIAEVRYDDQLNLGVSAKVPNQRVGGDGGPLVGGELLGATGGDVVLRVLQAGGIQADVVLSALAASSDVSILSRPIVLARNNEEARILVGSERPFVQIFRALPTDGAVRDQIVQYRDVGTSLTIRPTVNPDGYVSMDVLQEVSNATAETQFGAPVISTREARTSLMVRDGSTAVLGGLIDQQRETANSGIPVLKDIPLLGWLFRSTTTRRTTTELFLFLTPHVLANDEDLDDATRRLRDGTGRLRERVADPIPLLPGAPPAPPPDSLDRTPARR